MPRGRKKKSGKKPTRRRSRVGAMSLKNPQIQQLGGAALGFFFGDKINTMIDKVVPATVNPKIVAAGEIGIGALVALRKGKKSMIENVGGGVLAGAGVKRLMQSMGMMSGFQNVPVVSGYPNVPVIGKRIRGGYTIPAPMNGFNVPTPMNKIMGSVMNDGTGSDLLS